ncbi:MAG TPA: hypothetical protein PL012_23525, partial [Candidatus Obscuribacter sp.]|nr:hypothetical protein [Candidatus Obscuribacter sp.]
MARKAAQKKFAYDDIAFEDELEEDLQEPAVIFEEQQLDEDDEKPEARGRLISTPGEDPVQF